VREVGYAAPTGHQKLLSATVRPLRLLVLVEEAEACGQPLLDAPIGHQQVLSTTVKPCYINRG
jgi:hypothetical protein